MNRLLAAPSLRQIFDRNEGRLIHKCDHYFPIYERHLSAFRGRSPRVLEIGVSQGGSLDMWRRYFGRGTHIVGVDIEPRCADLARRGIDIRIGDQGDTTFLRSLVTDDGPFDVIIEDGSHHPAHQILALEELWPALNTGGVMLIEDLCTNYWPEYGGGWGKPDTFMEHIKPLVDELNAFNETAGEHPPTEFTRTCTGMHVYDSVVVFDRAPHEPLHTSMSGRPAFDTLYGNDALAGLEPEHLAAIEAMNRPHRRLLRVLRAPIQSAETAVRRVRTRLRRG
jgi:SAM-dependent methyltransferase